MLLAREVDARVVLVERDRDERVGLVVAHQHVEARSVLADELLLGDQRLGGVARDHALDPLGHGDHLDGLALGRGEVRADALLDRGGLADVDDRAVGVVEEVDAGLIGQLAALVDQLAAEGVVALWLRGLACRSLGRFWASGGYMRPV